jgi:hypothetical protein
MIIDSLCPPAVLYLGFSIVQIVIDLFRGQQNIAFLKVIVMIIFTILLNQLCMNGMTIVSWLIVFIPFITMTYMTTILLYVFGLNPTKGTTTQINNNNKQQDTQPNSRNCNLSTHGCCLDEVTAKIDSTGSNCVVKPHKENSKKYFTYPYFESSYLNYFSKKSSDPTSSPTPTPTSTKTSSTSTTTAPSNTPTPTPTTILASDLSLPLTINLVFGETTTTPPFNVYAKNYNAGSVTITYQWFRKAKGGSNYVLIPGQTDRTLPIVATVYNESSSSASGKFFHEDSVKCVAYCTVNSFTYTLESGVIVINVTPFRIINEPVNLTYASSANTIKVDVKVGKVQSSGSATAPQPTFKWMKVDPAANSESLALGNPAVTTDSGTNIVSSTYTIPSDLSAGSHYYYCNISATFGTVKTIDTKQITVTK